MVKINFFIYKILYIYIYIYIYIYMIAIFFFCVKFLPLWDIKYFGGAK